MPSCSCVSEEASACERIVDAFEIAVKGAQFESLQILGVSLVAGV